jgi:hypothetical protein
MSYLDKYVESYKADLRAEAVLNTLQKKILEQAKPPTEKEQVIQESNKLKNKGYADEKKQKPT